MKVSVRSLHLEIACLTACVEYEAVVHSGWAEPTDIVPGFTKLRLLSEDIFSIQCASMWSWIALFTTIFQLFLSQGDSSKMLKTFGSPYHQHHDQHNPIGII